MKEFFPTIPYIKYEGRDSKNPMSFRNYNPDEVILGKPMKDQLKFAMSYWHTMCADGTDMFGCGTNVKTYGETDPMELAKAKAHAAFEFMNKLSIDYYCFHDRDIAPEGASLEESNERLDVITPYEGKQQEAPLGYSQLLQQPEIYARCGNSSERRRIRFCCRSD